MVEQNITKNKIDDLKDSFILTIKKDFESQIPNMNHELGVGIDKTYYIDNTKPILQYNLTKEKLKSNNIKFEERIVYHGTYEENIENTFKNGFLVDKCGSRMPSHFGKGIYTSKYVDIAIYYCYGGINPKNQYGYEKAEHKLIACSVIVINEYKTNKRPVLFHKPMNDDYNILTATSKTENNGIHSETVIYDQSHILPICVIQTKKIEYNFEKYTICPYVFTRGKRKGLPCGKKSCNGRGSKMCNQHN